MYVLHAKLFLIYSWRLFFNLFSCPVWVYEYIGRASPLWLQIKDTYTSHIFIPMLPIKLPQIVPPLTSPHSIIHLKEPFALHYLPPPANGTMAVCEWMYRPSEVRGWFSEMCGYLYKEALDPTWRFDEALARINLFGDVILIRLREVNLWLLGQLIRYCEIWLNFAKGEFFNLRFPEDTAYRCSVFASWI